MAKSRTAVRTDLMNQRGGEFFSAYMTKARDKLTIRYNEAALKTVFGQ